MIINKLLLTNIRRCRWTLKLRDQASKFVINKVVELKRVGTIWYYLNIASNVLFQFRMGFFSKWQITCNIDEYHSTNDIGDICHDVITLEGFKFKFVPLPQGLYMHKVDPKSKENVFGMKGSNRHGDEINVFGVLSHVMIQVKEKKKQVKFD